MPSFTKGTEDGMRGRFGARRRALAAFSVVCAVGLLASAADSSLAGRVDRSAAKPVLRIGGSTQTQSGSAVNNNPAKDGTLTYISIAYAPLIHMKPKGELVPGLATSWRFTSSKAGRYKRFELTLRRGARFSNGEPVTAAAVVRWLNYMSKEALQSTTLGPHPQFVAAGPRTVVIQLTVPTPDLPSQLSDGAITKWGFVAAPQAVAKPDLFATRTYGAGPYMVDPSRTVAGDHWTYVPNPYYYDKSAVKFSRVTLKIIPTQSAMLQALQTNEIDVGQGDPFTTPAARKSGLQIYNPPLVEDVIALDQRFSPALEDVRVRQALRYAIDGEKIGVLGGASDGRSLSQMLTLDVNGGLANFYQFNPSKAESLLKAAGYPNGFSLKLMGPPWRVKQTQAVAAYWEKIGVKVDLDLPTSFAEYASKRDAGVPAMFTTEVIQSTTGYWSTMLSWIPSLSKSDPALGQILSRSLHSAKPQPLWKAFWTRVTKNANLVAVAVTPFPWYSRKTVGGVNPTVPLLGWWSVPEAYPVQQ